MSDPTPLEPSFEEFQRAYDLGTPQLVWTRQVADLETPVSALMKLTQDDDKNSFLLESVEGGAVLGRYSFIGLAPDVIWRCVDGVAEINRDALEQEDAFEACEDNPLDALRALVEESKIELADELPPMSTGVFGYMGYDMVRLAETLPDNNPDPLGIPESVMIRPTLMVVFDNIQHVITLLTPVRPVEGVDAEQAYEAAQSRLQGAQKKLAGTHIPQPSRPIGATRTLEVASDNTKEEFYEMVEKAKDYIRAGDAFQIVPSERFSVPFTAHPIELYRSLRRLNPSPFMVYLNFGGFSLVASSPEILVRVREGTVTIRPLAGSRPRGKTPEEDRRLTEELLADPKERAEHLMLLDLGRNDVGRVAEIGSVEVTEQFAVEYYSHIMHISSTVEGKLRSDLDALDALFAGFPAGTVTGAPKIRAMEIIDELEKSRRSFYAGCMGYIGAEDDMDTCISLRTGLIKDGMLYVQAGVGVVADSDPETEHEESATKARALIRAAEEAA